MKKSRIVELFTDFSHAYERLNEGIYSNIREDMLVDAVIQRFEFTFELSWKLMKSYLNFQGIEANSPRQAIKEAFKIKMIENGELWIDMLMDRNRTSHIYDEDAAKEIFNKIRNQYTRLFNYLLKFMEKEIENIVE